MLKRLRHILQKDDTGSFLGSMVILLLLWNPFFLVIRALGVDVQSWMPNGELLFGYLVRDSQLMVLFLLSGLFFIWRWQKTTWSRINVNKIREVITILCLILAYHFVAADINLYANSAFTVDRFIILLLAGLVYWHPSFVLPFVIYVLNFNEQFSYPLGFNSHRHTQVLIEFLFLFALYSVLKTFKPNIDARPVLIIGVVFVGSTYFVSGYDKLFTVTPNPLSWITQNNTVNLIAGARISYNWLGFIRLPTALSIYNFIDNIELLLNIFTIVAEVGFLLAFILGRRSMMICLSLIILLHLGIAITTGIVFRFWAILDIALLYLLFLQPQHKLSVYRHAIVIIIATSVLVTGSLLPRSTSYSWWDTGIYLNLDYRVITTSGDSFILPRQFLLPYEDLNRGAFTTLLNLPATQANNLGAGDYYYWQNFVLLDSPIDISATAKTVNVNQFIEEDFDNFIDLLVTSLTHYNQRGLNKNFLPLVPQFPPHYASMPNSTIEYYDGQAPIEQLIISYRLEFYNRYRDEFQYIEDGIVAELRIGK